MPQRNASPSAEAENLINFFNNDRPQIIGLIERQLNALHTRAQVIIGFAAVAVTTTGFSGRLIAGTSDLAQICIIAGLAIVLLSCLWTFLKVLSVDWVITRFLGEDLSVSIQRILEFRNAKTKAYRFGTAGVLLGLSVYGVAIAIMLLNPEPLAVPVR